MRTYNSLTNGLADIISATLFFHLFICGIIIALILLTIESNDHAPNVMCFASIGMIIISGDLFIYCKISENITNEHIRIGDAFYDRAWYQLSIKQQKFHMMPIQRAQMEFRLRGFGLIECSLTTFFSVCAYFGQTLLAF